MTTEQLMLALIGILLAIVSYFLIQTMTELKTTTKLASTNESDLKLLKQETESSMTLLKQETKGKHDRLEEKLDDLKESIQDLTQEIKILNKK